MDEIGIVLLEKVWFLLLIRCSSCNGKFCWVLRIYVSAWVILDYLAVSVSHASSVLNIGNWSHGQLVTGKSRG